jgi:hypothetical protein
MIQKPDKSAESHRPISLLPILSKLFEKLLFLRLIIIEKYTLISNHQFGFGLKQIIIEQIYRIMKTISNDMETGKYYTAIFLDVSQAFDKIWHDGLFQ